MNITSISDDLHFESIFNQSFQFAIILDSEGIVLKMNNLCSEVCGKYAEDVIGKPFWEAGWWREFHDVQLCTKKAVNSALNGDIVEDEVRFKDKNEDIRIGARIFSPIKDDLNKVMHISVVGLDVTEIKKSNERFKSFFNDSPVPIWEEDCTELFRYFEDLKSQGIEDFRKFFNDNPQAVQECSLKMNILDVNEAAVKLHGAKNKNELLGNLDKIFTQKSLEDFKEELIALANGEKEVQIEGEVKTLSGDLRYVSLNLKLQANTIHPPILALLTTVDITQRKEMELALAESEERSKLALESVSDALWDWHLVSGDVHFNPQWYTLLDYEPYELPQGYETWSSLLHPEDKSLSEETIERHLITGEPFKMEFRMRTKGGEWKWLLGRGKTVSWDANGQPQRMIGTNVDISDIKELELALKASEKELREKNKALRLSLDAAKAGTWTWDVESGEVAWDDQMQTIFGLEPGTFDGTFEGWKRRVHPDDIDTAEQKTLDALNHGTSYEYEYRVKGVDGEWRIVNAQAATLVNEAGKPIRMSGFATDITERRISEKSLIEAEKKYRTLVETSPFGIQLTDLEGKIIFSNPAHHHIQGYNNGELVGKYIWDFVANEENKEQTKTYYQFILKEQPYPETYFNTDKRSDGQLIETQINWDYIRNGNGELEGIISIISDITDQKKAEKELQISEAKYRQLIQTASDAIYLISKQGKFVDVNPAACNMLNRTREEILQLNINGIDPNFSIEAFLEFWKETPLNAPRIFETAHLHNDGSLIPVEVSGQKFAIGEEIFFFGIARNVSDRKKAEFKLIESQERWRNILVKTPQIGISLDTEARIIFANEYFLNLTGWRREEIINQDWFSLFIPEEIKNEVKGVFLSTMKQKSTDGLSTYENEIVTKDGDKRTISWSNVLTKDSEGNIKDITCLGIDLTERILAETALKESEAKYRSMMEAMDEPAYICSSDFRIEYMNPAMIKKVGRSANNELCHEVIHNNPLKCKWCEHEKVMRGEIIKTELVNPKDDQAYFISHSPIFHVDGSISKLTIYRDVTEIKKLENRLQQSQKMESIGTLAGGIAHDFNNILFPIVGQAEMLMEDFTNGSPEFDSAQEIFKAGKRGSDLVKQILSFSRRSEQQMMPVRIQKVLKEVLKLTRSIIPANIKINHQIQEDCKPILAEPTQLHQVLMNLITNAYHAVESNDGGIFIGLNETDERPFKAGISSFGNQYQNYALLRIIDTGAGIANEIINKIFDPYFTTKERGKGTGLGLAMVYGIIKEFNGEIRVFSQLGKGTTFKIYLPLIETEDSVELEEMSKADLSGNERILVVDDEDSIAKLETQMLERSGYTVTQRTSSIDALERFKATPDEFDLIVTDMAMPNMSGDILAEKILEIRPDIPIVICTGFSERLNRQRAETLGIKGYLNKPVVKSELTQLVRKLLDSQNP